MSDDLVEFRGRWAFQVGCNDYKKEDSMFFHSITYLPSSHEWVADVALSPDEDLMIGSVVAIGNVRWEIKGFCCCSARGDVSSNREHVMISVWPRGIEHDKLKEGEPAAKSLKPLERIRRTRYDTDGGEDRTWLIEEKLDELVDAHNEVLRFLAEETKRIRATYALPVRVVGVDLEEERKSRLAEQAGDFDFVSTEKLRESLATPEPEDEGEKS